MSDSGSNPRTKDKPDNEVGSTCGTEDLEDPKPDAKDYSLPCISHHENEPLTQAKVLEFFKLASNSEMTISVPPVCPQGGEVYLFVPDSLDTASKILV